MRQGAAKVFVAAVACALLTGGAASAATPQQIFRDIADNGKLDRKYSQRDIERALRHPGGADAALEKQVAPQRKPAVVSKPRSAARSADRGGLPFTGLDLALLTAGGGPLLLLGAALRRLSPARRRRLENEGALAEARVTAP